jgi:hypothetical protein
MAKTLFTYKQSKINPLGIAANDRLADCQHLYPRGTSASHAEYVWSGADLTRMSLHNQSQKKLMDALGLKSLLAPQVEHRGRAFGLVLEHESGWKIVLVCLSCLRYLY